MRTLNFQHVGRQMSESFLTAAVLSISGGLQDVYTYVSRGEVFANAQTGNIVLFSQNVFACNWELTIRYLVPVLFFAYRLHAASYKIPPFCIRCVININITFLILLGSRK